MFAGMVGSVRSSLLHSDRCASRPASVEHVREHDNDLWEYSSHCLSAHVTKEMAAIKNLLPPMKCDTAKVRGQPPKTIEPPGEWLKNTCPGWKEKTVQVWYSTTTLNNNWMTTVIGWSRHVTGSSTLSLVGGRVPYLDRKIFLRSVLSTFGTKTFLFQH